MLANQSSRPNPLHSCLDTKHETERLYAYWRYYAEKGRAFHEQAKTTHAIKAFEECIRISQLLLDCVNDKNCNFSGIELLFFGSHNLAACHNKNHKATQGEVVLRKLYIQIIALCKDFKSTRDVKLEALSVLDKSLFSLISQLAYMGKLSQINHLIESTENFAETIAEELVHI